MNSLDGSLFCQVFLCIFYFLSSMLRALWVLYIVIRSGPGAEFLLVIFITYFMSSSVKYMLLGLVSVFSRIVVISFSTSFLKVLSWLLLIVLLMLCCFSFSDILKSSKMYVFVILSSMGSKMFFFSSCLELCYMSAKIDSRLRIHWGTLWCFFLSFIFDSFINCWYFILAVCSTFRLAMLCLLLNLWLAFLSSFLYFLMSLLHHPLLSFFVASVCLEKRVALFIIISVSFFVWLSISSSVISVGNSSR